MRISIDAIPLLVRSAGVKNYLFHWIVMNRSNFSRSWTGYRNWIMKAPSRIHPVH